MTEPVWKRTLQRMVNDSEARKLDKRRHRPPNGGWYAYLPKPRVSPEFNKLLRAAAKARGISVGGYVRRATAKQVAKDLGMAWEDVIKHSPFPSNFAAPSAKPKGEPKPDNGEGYGSW